MTGQAAETATDGFGGSTNDAMLALGKLQYLASYCPMHRKYPAFALARLFFPALNNNCVRLFENGNGKTCAALIWARLSDEVSERMIYDRVPPTEEDWSSGHNLWFLDLLAPFGQGRAVARFIARNPPDGPFFFARIDPAGNVRKVIQGDASRPRKKRLKTFWPNAVAQSTD